MDRIGHYLSSLISNKERSDSFDTLDCVQIISVENDELILNSAALQNIFVENPQLEHNPLKVIVTCGLPRIGKSTFCNLLLKMMKRTIITKILILIIKISHFSERSKKLERFLKQEKDTDRKQAGFGLQRNL